MTSEEYIQQQIAAGYDMHYHDGVWWEKKKYYICKPAFFMRKIEPGKAKPKLSKSFMGYSHLVNDDRHANGYSSMMIMNKDILKDYSMQTIPSKKRSRIRKGLKLLEIKRINNIDEVIEDIQKICISVASRTGFGHSPKYYVKNYDLWKAYMTKEFMQPNREWWGAYYEGILISYRYDVLIDDMMYFHVIKSHTDYLNKNANDALMYSFIEYCKTLENCIFINAGEHTPHRPGINAYKESFGFEKIDLPIYRKYNPLARIAKRIIQFKHGRKSEY